MSISEPSKFLTPWAESGLKNPIPTDADPVTGRAGFDKGFPAINMTPKESGGIPPFGQDFNGIFFDITSVLRYMQAGGRSTFSSELAEAIGGYPKGAVVMGDDGVAAFQNSTDSNASNPNSGGSGWVRIDPYALTQQSGSLTPDASWADVPSYSDPNFGNALNAQAGALAARSELLMIDLREALRRSYAEAGYNLVAGSFEAGGTLVNTNDVLLQERTGKAFSGPAGVVAPGTDPTSGGFTDRSNALLSIWAGSVDAKYFGVDTTGVLPSDTQLLNALNYSAANGVEIVISGKCRLTKTMNQPLNSIVRCDGVVFCDNGALLTDGWMWIVGSAGDYTNRTEIRSLTLSTTSDTSVYVDLPIKGLKVASPKVACGVIRTYGLIMGGVEFGPTGFEITADEISNVARAWTPASRGTPGLKMTTTDCVVQRHFCVGYSVGGDYGSANYVGAAHVWGFPATIDNQYPNQQILTGVIFGASTIVNYIYADSVDTDGYNSVPSGNDGYCVVFSGWENKLDNLLYTIHPQTKPAKVKAVKFVGRSCEIRTLLKASGSNTTATPAIDYDVGSGAYYNIVQQANGVKSNTIDYGITLPPTGFTTFTGYQVIRTFDRMFELRLFHNASVVDAVPTSNFAIPLPTGLAGTQGATGIVSVHSCLNLGAVDVNIGDVFAVVDGLGTHLNLCYVRKDTGAQVFIKQNQLRAGSLQIVLYSANGNY